MPTCELCGDVLKTTQGLRGHLTFKHGVIGGGTQPVAHLATEQQVTKLEQIVEQLQQQSETVDNTALLKRLEFLTEFSFNIALDVESLCRKLGIEPYRVEKEKEKKLKEEEEKKRGY
jgi:hypothetical protein